MRRGDSSPDLRRWREQALARTSPAVLQVLRSLVPGGYYPDFLTPAESSLGLEAGIEAVLSTPRERMRAELDLLNGRLVALPSWVNGLRDGDATMLHQLGQALRSYYETAIEPIWPEAHAHVEADRAMRARALFDGGVDGLLNSFRPLMRWSAPVLELDVPYSGDLYLSGQGLLLIPSYLSRHHPDTLRDPALPPVLVYPVQHDLVLTARSRGPDNTLAALLGPTRAAILDTIASGRSTGELARQVGVSAGSVSQHTAVMRDAGLILTNRVGKSVVHTLTPAGAAVLNANEDPSGLATDRHLRSR